jgi:oligoribonuclease
VSRKDNLIWIDLEMTGLDPDQNRIIEIATAVTDKELTMLAEGPVFAIHQPDDVLGSMDEWNTRQHANSGLTERVRASEVSEAEAERLTLEFLRRHVDQGASPICGNSICQDRRFLIRHMPDLAAYFHYRNLDVSTLKILAKLWLPEVGNRFEKNRAPRARGHSRPASCGSTASTCSSADRRRADLLRRFQRERFPMRLSMG